MKYKTIKSYPNYEINKSGQIRNKETKKNLVGGIHKSGYRSVNLRRQNKTYYTYIHRHLAETFIGNTDGKIIDHIDGNKLNNNLQNLRICTIQENVRNQKARYGFSKYKGVHFNKRDKRWAARICVDRKRMWLGYFKDEKDAALAYNKAAKLHFKEFADLNKVE